MESSGEIIYETTRESLGKRIEELFFEREHLLDRVRSLEEDKSQLLDMVEWYKLELGRELPNGITDSDDLNYYFNSIRNGA